MVVVSLANICLNPVSFALAAEMFPCSSSQWKQLLLFFYRASIHFFMTSAGFHWFSTGQWTLGRKKNFKGPQICTHLPVAQLIALPGDTQERQFVIRQVYVATQDKTRSMDGCIKGQSQNASTRDCRDNNWLPLGAYKVARSTRSCNNCRCWWTFKFPPQFATRTLQAPVRGISGVWSWIDGWL